MRKPLRYAVRTWSWYPRATDLNPPIDNVDARLHDETDLFTQPEFARFLDFSGKSALHPRQLVKLPNGEFADLPVADRARRLLMVAEGPVAGAPGVFSALETETDAPCRRDGMVCRRGD